MVASALMDAGGPPLLAEWLLARGTDDLATVRQDCPRADWLVWLYAAAGLPTEQLAHAGAAAMRSILTLAPGCEWPLATMLRSVEGGTVDQALLPTSEEMALTIARLSGAAQRVALAVRSLYKVAVSHRVLSVQMVTAVVRAAALAPLEARHPELATLSSREVSQLLDRAFRSSSELKLVGGRGPEREPPSPGINAALGRLRELVATVRPALDEAETAAEAAPLADAASVRFHR